MPNYKDLMPNLNPLQNTIKKMTDFTLPTNKLNSYLKRAGNEAHNQTTVQRQGLQSLADSLSRQRTTSVNNLQRDMGQLPGQFSSQLREVGRAVPTQETQRGVAQSGLGLRNLLSAGMQPLAQHSSGLQQAMGQRGQIEGNYLSNLMSNVFNPQRQLAQQQGQEGANRYQTYVNEAQQAMMNGRVSEAEQLLTKAQLEYNSYVRAQEEAALRQQMGYQMELNELQNISPGGNFGQYRVTSGFGPRKAPTKGASTNHKGIDYGVPMNTPISATVGGTIVHAGNKGSGYGNYVTVRDDNGYHHIYAHLNSVGVKVGDRIQAGQTLGRSGMTGTATGPHLHYEVRKGSPTGTAVNPAAFVR